MQRRIRLSLLVVWLVSGGILVANPVIRCNELALDAIRFANTPPPVASRNLAILHLAIFDAANGLGGPCVSSPAPRGVTVGWLVDAAIAAAANRVLRLSWPQFAYTFDAELSGQLLALPLGANRETGVAWGRWLPTPSCASAISTERTSGWITGPPPARAVGTDPDPLC